MNWGAPQMNWGVPQMDWGVPQMNWGVPQIGYAEPKDAFIFSIKKKGCSPAVRVDAVICPA
jgi:hypothetical protein